MRTKRCSEGRRIATRLTAWALLCGSLLVLPATLAADTSTSSGVGGDLDALEHPGRRVGTNLDPIVRLDRSLPKTRSLTGWSLPESYTRFKKDLHEHYGLKLGLSYQSLYQKASESLTETDSAWGGWYQLEAAWTAINRDRDYEGTLVVVIDGRYVIDADRNSAPGMFGFEVGSLWPTDSQFLDWDPYAAALFWEQWGKKERVAMRVGQLAALSALDPFRFDDPQIAFTGSPMAFHFALIPVGAPGLGLAGRWWPIEGSEWYFRGIVNDINSPAGEFDWSGIFDHGEVFAGGEIGYDWFRAKEDFDHVHLTCWYADRVSTASFDTEAGWGAKVHGSKQWNKIVAWANYGYNTAEGGGFGLTNSRQAINTGVAYLHPWRLQGEIALGGSWAEPLDDRLREQYGAELYWRILLMSNFWLTPGVQHLVDPTFNTETDQVTIGQVKFSLFF